jgi:hypothetical protein
MTLKNLYLIIPTPRSGNFHSQRTLSLFGNLVPVTSELVMFVAVAFPLLNDCIIKACFAYPMFLLLYLPF